MSKSSSSLKELKGLREAVLAEEKARTQALLQNLPDNDDRPAAEEPLEIMMEPEAAPSAEAADPLPEPQAEPEATPEPEPSPERPPRPAPAPSPPRRQPPPAAAAPPQPAPTKKLPAERPTATGGARPPSDTASKGPTLTIALTPKIQERIQAHVQDSRWSPAELLLEVLRVTLHRGYPGIRFDQQELAAPGCYRTFERNPHEAELKIISGRGVFRLTVLPEHPELQQWLPYFTDQRVPNPQQSAEQMCLYSLQAYLENLDDFSPNGWVKDISTEAYSLAAET